MSSPMVVGFSDADAATLADIVHGVRAAQADVEAAQARVTRELARAFRFSEAQTQGAPARVRSRDMALRAIAAEIAGETRSTDRSVQNRISTAVSLVDGYPATMAAWEDGRITRAHVLLITDLGAPLPPDARAEFEQIALPRCEDEVAGRLRGELGIVAERLHPRSLTERHQDAKQDVCVKKYPLQDGISALLVTGPTPVIDGTYDRVTTLGLATIDARTAARDRVRARAVKTAAGEGAATGLEGAVARAEGTQAGSEETATGAEGAPDRSLSEERSDETKRTPHDDTLDPSIEQDEILASDTRTLDQLRADIVLDLLLAGQPMVDPTRAGDGPGTFGTIRAKVQVVVPALTLLGANEHPADLNGHAPIDADTARRIAGATPEAWVRVLTHPVSGRVHATDTRFAEGPLRNFLKARDRHCRFPGCRVPATRCENDHTIDWAHGGPTTVENMAELCQRHHSMKQFTAWKVRQLGDGLLEWTSPLGKTYIDEPPAPTVHFVPDDSPGDGTPPPDRMRTVDLDGPLTRVDAVAPPPREKSAPPRTHFTEPPPF